MQRGSTPERTMEGARQYCGALARIALICMVVIFAPFITALAEETQLADPEVEGSAPEVVTPTPSPEPTIPPAPHPTEEPTVVPTVPVEPTATTESAPEPTATAEPTATEVVTPEPTEEPTPTPEPTASPTPEPTKPPRVIRPQAVIKGDQCSPFTSDTVGYPDYTIFNCQGMALPGTLTVRVTGLTPGWQYQVVESQIRTDREVQGLPAWITGPIDYSLELLGQYQIYFGPASSETVGCGQVTVTVTQGHVTSVAVLEARTPGAAPRECPEPGPEPIKQIPTARIEGALPPVIFSHQEQVNRGDLRIKVENPDGATGWTLDASATNFSHVEAAPGVASRAGLILRVSIEGEQVALSPDARQLVTDGRGDTAYTFPLDVVIPGGSPAGTYSSTITLATAAAPGKP